MYKKVYLEITNNCNLNCHFCPQNKRSAKNISLSELNIVLKKLEGVTEYLYLHVLGEPLLHPNIDEIIDIAANYFKINITTNGYLIKRIQDNKNIRQLNISLQSFNEINNKSLEEYMHDIFLAIELLKTHTYICLRLWIKNKNTEEILRYINNKYNKDISYQNKLSNIKLEENVFLSFQEEFVWPNIKNDRKYLTGTCYALKDHIAILVDGSVIPCCLDSEGIIKLGNIYEDTIADIQSSDRYQKMLSSFKDNKKCEELCQTCNFINKKTSNN